jgi:hypothetical protein
MNLSVFASKEIQNKGMVNFFIAREFDILINIVFYSPNFVLKDSYRSSFNWCCFLNWRRNFLFFLLLDRRDNLNWGGGLRNATTECSFCSS